jgi:hypothetical protein
MAAEDGHANQNIEMTLRELALRKNPVSEELGVNV